MEITPSVLTDRISLIISRNQHITYGLHRRMQVRMHLSYLDKTNKSSDMYFHAHLEVLPLCVHQDARLLPLGQVK